MEREGVERVEETEEVEREGVAREEWKVEEKEAEKEVAERVAEEMAEEMAEVATVAEETEAEAREEAAREGGDLGVARLPHLEYTSIVRTPKLW